MGRGCERRLLHRVVRALAKRVCHLAVGVEESRDGRRGAEDTHKLLAERRPFDVMDGTLRKCARGCSEPQHSMRERQCTRENEYGAGGLSGVPLWTA